MSRRDWYCFLSGAACTLLVLVGSRSWIASEAGDGLTANHPAGAAYHAVGTTAETSAAGNSPAATAAGSLAATTPALPATAAAGSLEEVTRRLAARLAAGGGTDQDWRLLEQSFAYLGRTEDARAARTHIVRSSAAQNAPGTAQDALVAAQDAPGAAPDTPVSSSELAQVAHLLDSASLRAKAEAP